MFWENFLHGNEWQWRLLRTVVQGVLSVLIASLDVIVDGFEKFHCSYSSFSIFRRQILRGWNKEFGVLYELFLY